MDLKLKDKMVFISGTTAGIGFAIAKRFLQEGAQVIINGRTKETVNKAVSELSTLIQDSNISGIAADFSKKEDVNSLLEQLPEVDILINTQGSLSRNPLERLRTKNGLDSLN